MGNYSTYVSRSVLFYGDMGNRHFWGAGSAAGPAGGEGLRAGWFDGAYHRECRAHTARYSTAKRAKGGATV